MSLNKEFISSLIKRDPVGGIADFTNATKPYHTKLLDTTVENVVTDDIHITIRDRIFWCLQELDGRIIPPTIKCPIGYGILWDSRDYHLKEYVDYKQPIVETTSTVFFTGKTVAGTKQLKFDNSQNRLLLEPGFKLSIYTDSFQAIDTTIVAYDNIEHIATIDHTFELEESFFASSYSSVSNSIVIEKAAEPLLNAVLVSHNTSVMVFTDMHRVLGSDRYANELTVEHDNFKVGQRIYIEFEDTSEVNSIRHITYTVKQVRMLEDGGFAIVLNEPLVFNPTQVISSLYTEISLSKLRMWEAGTEVTLSYRNNKKQLNEKIDAYFQPHTNQDGELGISFTLSSVVVPQNPSDYISISDKIPTDIVIQRRTPFAIGENVAIRNSEGSINDGIYVVKNSTNLPNNKVRIVVDGVIPVNIPKRSSFNQGYVERLNYGYDAGQKCIEINRDPLFADTKITDHLEIKIDIKENDIIEAKMIENQITLGWGEAFYGNSRSHGFGNSVNEHQTIGITWGGDPFDTSSLFPMGFDSTGIDMSLFDE